MAKQVKTVDIGGDELQVIWNGNVWECPATHRTFTSARAAMREELEQYLAACGDDPTHPDAREEIETLLDSMRTDSRDEVLAAIDAADLVCPEQVADAVLAVWRAGKDWREELGRAVANDASERKTAGIE